MGDTMEMAAAFEGVLKTGDFGRMNELIQEWAADDFVQEWPQSGERIRGRENSMAINQNYPGFPKQTMGRTVAGGDLVTSEVTLNYGGEIYHAVSIFQFKDGKITKETDYFSQPFDAPQ